MRLTGMPARSLRVRTAVADGEAALWRATAEVLLLDREIWREHARRGAAMGRFSGDHYRALRLLGSYTPTVVPSLKTA